MKKTLWLGCLSAALFLVVGGKVAMADTYNMTFNSVGGASLGGEYVYPYNFTITGAHGATWHAQLMCIDFHDNISFGESWTATEESAAVAGKKFEEAAWLLNYGITNNDVANANWAVWELFETVPAGSPDESALLAMLGSLTTADLAAFGNWQVFIPTGSTQFPDGGPQWFIGGPGSITPEPGALLLLGTGILGLALLIRFRNHTPRLPSLTI